MYYPGDPSLDMAMVHIDTDFLGGTGPYAMIIQYAADTGDRYMTVTLYTPEQFAADGLPSGAGPAITLDTGTGDAIYELGGGGLPQTTLVAPRPGAVVVVSGNPDMKVSELSDVAASLRSVEN